MPYHDHVEIVSEEQATKWVCDLTAKVETIRAHLDMEELRSGRKVDIHRSEFRQMLMHYGVAMGALQAMVHTRKISERAYGELRTRVMVSMQPKVVVT